MKDSLRRFPVAQLPDGRSRKGSKLVTHRNFLIGRENYQRFTQNDRFHIQIKLEDKQDKAVVVVRSNHSGDWEEYPLSKIRESTFEVFLPLNMIGVFQFKIRYSFTGGKSWHWDNVPYSSIFVESARLNDLKIYTLIPTVSGSIKEWIKQLHRVKQMGFNVIHLLPVTHMDTSQSPYAAYDLFNIDPSFLNQNDSRESLEQLEEFILEAKHLDIMLCFDIVVNHVGVTSELATQTPNWIITDGSEDDGLRRAGCWDGTDWVSWRDIALIEYDHPDQRVKKKIWKYMSDYMLFWAHYADFTGGMIRLDNLHSSNRNFLEYAMKELRRNFPDLIIFAELFTDQQTISKMVFHNEIQLLLATPWIAPFTHSYREAIGKLHSSKDKLKYLFPVNSHDSKSIAEMYGASEALIPRYALNLLLGTGATGLVQGAEFGTQQKVEFIGRKNRLPSCDGDYSYELRLLHAIFNSHKEYVTNGSYISVDGGHDSIIAGIRVLASQKTGIAILANLDTQSDQSITINFSKYLTEPVDNLKLECLFGNPKSDVFCKNGSNHFSIIAVGVQVYRFEL